ncbi:MAG: DUF6691 family protein [Methylovirgula sp.]
MKNQPSAAFLAAFFCGLLFGIGLIVAQMTNPEKVLNFLDIAGTWDPSLAFVMGGAIPVAALGFILMRRRKTPVFAETFQLPQKMTIDAPLLIGAALFGIGWGLVGFCPGPALTALGFGHGGPIIFVIAMIVGMAGFDVLEKIQGGQTKDS